jgi:hypothetical protein
MSKNLLEQLAALGWTVIDQGQGIIPSDPAASLRDGFRGWLLPGVFRDAVRAINIAPDGALCLTGRQFDDLRDQILRLSNLALLEANEATQHLPDRVTRQALRCSIAFSIMPRLDFTCSDLSGLTQGDLRFLVERFPAAGQSYEAIAANIQSMPSTLESWLSSEYAFREIVNRRELLLDVSPFLLFNVLLRRSLGKLRTAPERKAVNYIANVLALFARTDRLYRVQPGDRETKTYIVDMLAEAAEADGARQFCIYAHVGNFTLFVTGVFPAWIEHRHRYKRRPVDRGYYAQQGQTYYHQAAVHHLARDYGLDDVFMRLALNFDGYARALNYMVATWFHGWRIGA